MNYTNFHNDQNMYAHNGYTLSWNLHKLILLQAYKMLIKQMLLQSMDL